MLLGDGYRDFIIQSLFSMLCLMDLKIEIEWLNTTTRATTTTLTLTTTRATTEKRT